MLRAATARAIVAAGLHPGTGLFHRHPQNPMPLADDLMEPFRPDVDLKVKALIAEGCPDMSPDTKRELVSVLAQPVALPGGISPLSTAVLRLAQSVSACFLARGGHLTLPLAARLKEWVETPLERRPNDDEPT